MIFDPELTNILRDALPWAGPFFRAITELGGELFFMGLVLVGFWAFRKKEAIVATLILLFTYVLNYWIKIAIANPRPDQATYWYEGYEESNYSTPSAHSQNTMTLFGWFTAKTRMWWMFLLSAVLILLIGLSRVYLGVHYLGDVLIGWGIGVVLLVTLIIAEEPLSLFLARFKTDYLYMVLFTFGLLATVVTTILAPPSIIPGEDNFGALGGLFMGLAIGLLLENKYVNFSVEPISNQKWRLVVRVVVGLVLVIGLMMGLSLFLVSSNIWFRAARYGLVAFVGTFLWPLIFTKAKL